MSVTSAYQKYISRDLISCQVTSVPVRLGDAAVTVSCLNTASTQGESVLSNGLMLFGKEYSCSVWFVIKGWVQILSSRCITQLYVQWKANCSYWLKG